MSWTWPVTWKGLLGACGNSKVVRISLGLWGSYGCGQSCHTVWWAPAPCIYRALQQVEDLTNGLPGSSSNAENHYSGSETAVYDISPPPQRTLDSNTRIHFTSHEFRNGQVKMTNTGTSTCPQPHRCLANWKNEQTT